MSHCSFHIIKNNSLRDSQNPEPFVWAELVLTYIFHAFQQKRSRIFRSGRQSDTPLQSRVDAARSLE